MKQLGYVPSMTNMETVNPRVGVIAGGKGELSGGTEAVRGDASVPPLKHGYTVHGFLRYLRESPWDLLLGSFFVLLGYELKMFGNSFSIDTEGMMQVQESLYRSWITLDRFGLLLLKKVLGLYWYNNAVASFLTAVFLLLSALLWAYLFSNVFTLKRKFHPIFFVGPFVASPVLAEMLGFSLSGPEIGIALSLVAVSLMLLLGGFAYMQWWKGALSIIAAAMAFSLYLAMVTVFVAGFAMTFLLLFWNNRGHRLISRIMLIGSGAGVFGIAYLLYKLLNAYALKVYNLTTDPYITEQSRWGKDSVRAIVKTIWLHAVALYSGEGIYYSGVFPWLLVVFMLIMLVALVRRHIDVLTFLVAICLCASPMMMSVILGAVPSVRTEMAYSLMLAFVVAFLAAQICDVCSIRGRDVLVKEVAMVLVFALSWSQALIVNRIFYTESINHQQDMELAQAITTRINDLDIANQSEKTLVFLNWHKSHCNKDCYTSDQLGLVGRSLFEVTVSPSQGTYVKTNFMNIVGNNFRQADAAQLKQAEKIGTTMPHWPMKGSVTQKGELIIVNF